MACALCASRRQPVSSQDGPGLCGSLLLGGLQLSAGPHRVASIRNQRLATDSSDRSECTCFSARWRRLATGSIRPAGWLQTQMQLQVLNTVMVFVSGCLTSPFRTESKERDCSMRRIESTTPCTSDSGHEAVRSAGNISSLSCLKAAALTSHLPLFWDNVPGFQ